MRAVLMRTACKPGQVFYETQLACQCQHGRVFGQHRRHQTLGAVPAQGADQHVQQHGAPARAFEVRAHDDAELGVNGALRPRLRNRCAT